MTKVAPVILAVLALGCGPKAAGQACVKNEDCAKGLVCVSDICADALAVTKKRAQRVQTLVEQYMHEHDAKCPTGISELRDADSIRDPWGNPFDLACPGTSALVDVISRGPDGEPNTGDEISTRDK